MCIYITYKLGNVHRTSAEQKKQQRITRDNNNNDTLFNYNNLRNIIDLMACSKIRLMQ